MRIDQIQLKDFRKFENATFSFHPKFNLLVGENGSGKTTILEALALAMEGLARHYSDLLIGSNLKSRGPHFFETQPAAESRYACHRLVITTEGQRFVDRRFRYQVTVDCQWPNAHDEPTDCTFICCVKQNNDFWESIEGGLAITQHDMKRVNNRVIFPCFAYYNISRAKKLEEQPIPMNLPLSKDGYADCWTGEFSNRLLNEWFLNREVTAAQEGPIPELETVRSAIAKAIPGCENVRFLAKFNSLVIEMQNGENLPFNYLSDGYRNMLSVVADIAHRMARLNPDLGDGVLEFTPGIVLIDELDLHLHPKWQRIIVDVLQNIFPKVQFIATTHSPQIISHVKPERIRILRDGEEEFYTPDLSYGLTSDAILADIMDVNARPDKIADNFNLLFEKIERLELDEAKELVKNLKKKIISDPQILEAEHLIKWKERKK